MPPHFPPPTHPVSPTRPATRAALSLLLAAVALPLALPLAACSSDDEPASNKDNEGASALVATYTGEVNGDAALAAGKLYEKSGCLALRSEDGPHFQLIIPEGEISTDPATRSDTFVIGGREYRLGDAVEVGGSGHTFENQDGIARPEGCRLSGQVWYANTMTPSDLSE